MTTHDLISGIAIRRAVRADLNRLLEMVSSLAAHHGDVAATSREALESDLFGASACVTGLVAERNGAIAGYALLCILPRVHSGRRQMELHHLFVEPAHRGHGIGRRLIAAAVEQARRGNCGRLMVGTHPDNETAREIYRALGFVPAAASGPRLGLELPAGQLPAGWV